AYQALTTQGNAPSIIVWDAVSSSAFVASGATGSIQRYGVVNGQFQLITSRSFGVIDGIAMSPDHSALIMQSGGLTVYKLSPTDLSTIAQFKLTNTSDNAIPNFSNGGRVPLPVMGDNRLFNFYAGWVDLNTGVASPTNLLGYQETSLVNFNPVSGNRQRMLWPDNLPISASRQMFEDDLENPGFKESSNRLTYSPFNNYVVSHDGNTWSFNTYVYDFNMDLLGQYALPTSWLSVGQAMSRSGQRLYAYATSYNNNPRIYVFDTSAPDPTTGKYAIVGYIPVNIIQNCTDDACDALVSALTITDDDQTLLLAGTGNFVAQPIPATLLAPVIDHAKYKFSTVVRMSASGR
ncbi:MAG TPA: hypothetical protein VK832_19420, partial [Burkholderiaceae bacterium]|nr:hypothetical protein [Burkholderiaceae bacterium]